MWIGSYLDKHKSKDKEWKILRNEKNVRLLSIDDLKGVPKEVKKELINREQTKEQVAAQTKEQVATQTKSCNCGCDGQKEGFVSTDLEIFSNKTLLFMIFILAAFCFIQYLNQQKMNNQLDNMMFLMYNTRNNSAVVHPASITPIATPATPATPAN